MNKETKEQILTHINKIKEIHSSNLNILLFQKDALIYGETGEVNRLGALDVTLMLFKKIGDLIECGERNMSVDFLEYQVEMKNSPKNFMAMTVGSGGEADNMCFDMMFPPHITEAANFIQKVLNETIQY